MNSFETADRKLRMVLRANAGFSLLSALCFIAIPQLVAEATGIMAEPWIRGVGFGLLGFGAYLIFLARPGNRSLPALEGWMVVAGDAIWVLASVAGLALWGASLSTFGLWLVIDIALVVAIFAFLQAKFIAARARA